ncbi:hypothetical protein B0J17DRAFT_716322 [Rhizoctonia solani]|nr:hypothetical protein B0J17DRAFT_716322 [Rhizoctonia solani]
MTLAFEIVSLVLSVVQTTATIGQPIVQAEPKEAAQQAYNEAAHKFSLMRGLRNDILINQYLSEYEKAEVDSNIEMLVFNLMALERALEKVKAISYWKIRSELRTFNESRLAFTESVAGLRQEIQTRSSQGRERAISNSRAMPISMESTAGQSQLAASSVTSESDINHNSDSDARRDILDALEVTAASSIRSTVERMNPNYQDTEPPAENAPNRGAPALAGFVGSPIGMSRPTVANIGNPWHVPARPGSALSFISQSANIELEVFGEVSTDID